ncbi:S-layer homology domain-containing protein [Syntrophomonas palmitatica]|uniref:S-layer homology domain-containing protein n=1 Tax=Syntrophomonas palmitatica TaxID=402877 RepID=UPI0006D0FEAD|nr:S-layer homology domain-containing protein [Syntrophomonas palmitatica]
MIVIKTARKISFITILIALIIFNIGVIAMAAGEPAPASKAAGLVPPYNDVAPGDPDTVFIKYISQKGIISGFPDGSYHPAEGLTRAQAAVVICKAAALKTPAANNQTFKDVSLAHWSAPYVDAAVKAGYIKGFPDGTYKPEEKLTRAQGISLIMRLCTQKERAELPSVQDMNNQHWAAKDMGTAIALKMIETTKDGKQIHPEADMTRASLARALAILLTKDPGLNQVKLTGKLTEIKGQVTLTRNNQTQNLKNDTTICEADIIKTGSDGRARIIYPDGSGTLIEENSEIAIKKAEGKNYIKQDGTPGTAVEFLNLDLNKGTLFGALSTKTENEKEKKQAGISHIFASREALTQLAAADNTQPWYQTAEKKKVKVKVDMPWGVAAVRGTFIKVSVNPDGTCDVSCLTGSAELSGSSGGLTSLGGGQSSSIGSQGGAPSQAAAMSEADKAAFAREQEWVVNTALLVDTNKAAEVLVKTDDSQTVEQQAETTVKTVIEALKASGIQLRPEVIEKLKEDIQSKLNEEAAKSLISAVDKAGVTNNTNSNLSNLSNLSNSSDSSNSSSYIAYNTAGTYGGQSASSVQTITGTVVVNVPGVTLQNLIITGNLVLAAGIGEGDVTLNNVKVQGAATVNGGGSSSVNIADSQINTVLVQKTGSSVRIVVSGSTAIGNLTLNSGAILAEESNLTGTGFSNILTGLSLPEGTRIVLSGNFASINIASPGLIIEVESGTIGQIRLAETATGTSLNLASGVTVSAWRSTPAMYR